MDINRSVQLLLCITAIYSLGAASGCKSTCPSGSQDNRIFLKGGTVIITPDLDSIKIGDTLWLTSSIPTVLKYAPTGSSSTDSLLANKTVDYSGASDVTTDFHLDVLKGVNLLNGAIDSFKFTSSKGIILTNPFDSIGAKTARFDEESGEYKFSVGLIPNNKGTYCLAFLDIYRAQKKCSVASIQVLMNSPDSHLHYLRDIFYGRGSESPVETTHDYCFKVY